MKLIFSFWVCFGLGQVYSEMEFDRPWKKADTALILDPYAGNEIDFNKIVLNPRLAGIIHRASIGMRVDKKFAERKKKAEEKGLLWGSYHLGKPGDPIQQAEFYLSAIQQDSTNIMALDLEDVENSAFMNMANAVKFISYIKQKTGKYPVIYANQKVAKAISAKFDQSSVFAHCPLWYARFRNVVTDFPSKVWKTYTFWQFACEINCCECVEKNTDNNCKKYKLKYLNSCPYKQETTARIEGIACDMDVNLYNGTVGEITEKWKQLGR